MKTTTTKTNGTSKVTLPRNDPIVKRLLAVAKASGRSTDDIVNSILKEQVPKMENEISRRETAKTIPTTKATWREVMMREIRYPKEVRLQDTPMVINLRVLERIVARASGMSVPQAHTAMAAAIDVVITKAGKASTKALSL
jgi:hypothetical protein